jgi:GT2 family glycosyltransferase
VTAHPTAPPRSPGRRLGTAQLITVEDLPVARTEVELSAPQTKLVLAEPSMRTRRILALVRLHTHPLGIVVLDGTINRSWATHSPTVWSAMRGAINDHLAADGLPPVDGLDLLTCATHPLARCAQRRAEVLAKPPHITVVVATRERPDSLRSCLYALLDLEYPRYDIVVVDNDPDTAYTSELLAHHFSESVHYVRENRRGLASAHNRGLVEAQGEIVAFVDDDVTVDRHWLTGIAEGFAAAADVGCVTGLILPAQLDTPAQLLLERHGGFDKGFGLRIFDTDGHRPDDPLFPFTAGRFGSGANMAFDTAVLRRLGGFDPAIGIGTFARGGDDLAAFFRVVLGHRVVYQPAAMVWHRHHREMAALRNQAFGYGVGLGAYLTSVLMREPRMWPLLLRRLLTGVSYAFNSSSARNRGRYEDWPSELARLERRGLTYGPAAYAVSRWRTRGANAGAHAGDTGG